MASRNFAKSKSGQVGRQPDANLTRTFKPYQAHPPDKALGTSGTDAKAQTYAQQGSLPHLPIPPLGRTLEKLKSSLRAMARDENEYAVAIAKIDAFGQAKGPGEVLQKRLEERKVVENKERGSWLEAWWDDLAYMGYRDSVSLFFFSQTPSHSITGGHQRFILLYVHHLRQDLTNDPNRRIRPPTINAHPTAANLL